MQVDVNGDHKARKYIPQIDSLRAIAVLAVLLYHANFSILPGGFSGVDVFFVISGYVVSTSLARDALEPLARFLLNFYARRILRIVPALLACLAVTSVAATMLIPKSWLSSASRDTAIYAFFGLSNVALIRSSDGYFPPTMEFNPFTHTWSLGVEEQFYLVFPLIFFIWIYLRHRSSSLRQVGNWLLFGILILSLVYSWKATESSPIRAFYLLPSRLWELAAGALLFQLQSYKKISLNSGRSADWVLSLGLILILSGFFLSQPESFPFPWALLAVGGTMLSILGVSSDEAPHSRIAKTLNNPAIVFIGTLSYSLYLWHWPVYVLFRWTIGLERALYVILAILLTAILALLSFYLLENRIRENGFVLKQRKWRVVAGGIACILICKALTNQVFKLQDRISLSVTKDSKSWYPNPDFTRARVIQDHCKTEIKKSKLTGVGLKIFLRSGCDPAPPPPHQLFVVGDSHADAYARMLYKIAAEQGVKVLIYSKAGCSVANLYQSTVASGTECVQFVRTAMADIKARAATGDTVFLAALRMIRLSDQMAILSESEAMGKQNSDQSRAERAAALQEADDLLNEFAQKNLHVVLDAPKPIFKSPAFRCSDWFNAKNPICGAGLTMNRKFLLDLRQPIMDSLAVLSAKYPRLVIWDPFPILCPQELCAAVDPRGPLFFDGDHLSGNGNLILYPSFLATLKHIWILDPRGES